MAWTNAFDLGACTVALTYASTPSVVVYSGVMAKGQSVTIPDLGAGLTPAGGTLAVSTLGVVSLTSDATGVTDANGFEIDVTPSYWGGLDARLVGASSSLTSLNRAIGAINALSTRAVNVDYLEWTGAPPTIPNPADLSALTGQKDLIGFFAASL